MPHKKSVSSKKSVLPKKSSGSKKSLQAKSKSRTKKATQPPLGVPLFELGAAYYPDYVASKTLTRLPTSGRLEVLGQKQRIKADFERMVMQGIHTIRMGEFSWQSVEPKRGAFNADCFQYALDCAQSHGIKVIFCTPTATPPKWLIDEHPDILPVTRSGAQIPFGSRRHYDACHPEYIKENQRITSIFARTFGKHPSIVGWQTDNEFGCHNSVFLFTEHCRNAFRAWCKVTYKGDIEALNEAWFTCFWSQGYTSFAQIELPFNSWSDQNPSLELDFRRFSNAMVAQFQADQIAILKRYSPGRFVTHNFMTLFTDLCPWTLSADLDVAGFDHYQMEPEPHPVSSHWQFALMYSLKQKPFLVLEQQPLQVNWQPVNRRFSPDWLFLWGMQSAFLGARGMLYFSWQRMAGGAEQYHDGVVPHDVRVPKSMQEKMIAVKNTVFSGLQKTFELPALPTPQTDVLCILDFESLWSHEITSQSLHYSTRKQVDAIAELCHGAGLGLGFAPSLAEAGEGLLKATCVVLPGHAFELSPEEKNLLRRYLEQGGRVLSLPRTAMKQRNNQMSSLPLCLFDALDFYFEEHGALLESETEIFVPQGSQAKKSFTGRLWAEKIKIVNTKKWRTLARFKGGLYAGSPAAMQCNSGSKGGSWTHLAVCPDSTEEFCRWLLTALKLAPRTRVLGHRDGLQVYPLRLRERSFLAAVNFGSKPKALTLGAREKARKSYVASLEADLTLKVKRQIPKGKQVVSKGLLVPARGVVLLELGGAAKAPRFAPRKGR